MHVILSLIFCVTLYILIHYQAHTCILLNFFLFSDIHAFDSPKTWSILQDIAISGILITPSHLNAALSILYTLHSSTIGAAKVITPHFVSVLFVTDTKSHMGRCWGYGEC